MHGSDIFHFNKYVGRIACYINLERRQRPAESDRLLHQNVIEISLLPILIFKK